MINMLHRQLVSSASLEHSISRRKKVVSNATLVASTAKVRLTVQSVRMVSGQFLNATSARSQITTMILTPMSQLAESAIKSALVAFLHQQLAFIARVRRD
jgi:hypothetical protein